MYDYLTIDAGAKDCPVILHVPHASRHIPDEVAADFVACLLYTSDAADE